MSIPQNVIRELQRIFGERYVLSDEPDRRRASRDLCPRNLIVDRESPSVASVVVRPFGADFPVKLRRLVEYALSREPKLRLVARGGGSGVCGAQNAQSGDVVVDMSLLNRVTVSPTDGSDERSSLILQMDAGAGGKDVDRALIPYINRLTHGHFPASYHISTFGGWVQAGSSGQYAAQFGKIDDRVSQIQGIDGLGREFVHRSEADFRRVIGMEGTTALVTGGSMPLVPLPPSETYLAFTVPNAAQACALLQELHGSRDMLRANGAFLYVVRCYDWFDRSFIARPHRGELRISSGHARLKYSAERWLCGRSRSIYGLVRLLERNGHAPWTGVILIRGLSQSAVAGAVDAISGMVFGHKGRLQDPAIAKTWHENRFKLGYDKLLARYESGILADTFDCTPSWATAPDTYERVRRALAEFGVVGAHLCMDLRGPYLYFTFAMPGTDGPRHRDAWSAALAACIAGGSRTNHHHGIGRLKGGDRNELVAFANGVEWLANARAVKREMDPHGILNPRNLT